MVSVNTKQNCGTVTKNPRCTEVFYSKILRYTEEFYAVANRSDDFFYWYRALCPLK